MTNLSLLPLIAQGAFVGYLIGQAWPINESPAMFIAFCVLNAALTVGYGTMKSSEA